jgi:hypothetical protein
MVQASQPQSFLLMRDDLGADKSTSPLPAAPRNLNVLDIYASRSVKFHFL